MNWLKWVLIVIGVIIAIYFAAVWVTNNMYHI